MHTRSPCSSSSFPFVMTGTVLDEYQKFGVLLNLLDFRSLVVETFLALEDVSLLIRCLKKINLSTSDSNFPSKGNVWIW